MVGRCARGKASGTLAFPAGGLCDHVQVSGLTQLEQGPLLEDVGFSVFKFKLAYFGS